MSIRILKPGLSDSFQDLGRYGFQYLGINPGGAMDPVAAQVANMLAGNDVHEAVIEMHFPASSFLFKEDALIALSGADFNATLNEQEIPLCTPIVVRKFSVMQFINYRHGGRCYLAVHGGFDIPKWLDSYSTHLKAKAGGFHGRCLDKDDELLFRRKQTDDKKQASDNSSHGAAQLSDAIPNGKDHRVLSWKADTSSVYNSPGIIRICEGSEFKRLTNASRELLTSSSFTITRQSDRMGYRMSGASLHTENAQQLISSAVTKGTIQLFPDGQIIILMADHQTTGGYPKIAHVISADIPKLAQLLPGAAIQFQMIEHSEAEELLFQQHRYLQVLQSACTLHLTELL
ncbi:MAG TPA: biotin-dependent carboxyltransferase family protein [Chitinophagales bacterium]|nr:biotin-dependent carboxyltransferase family protein [Chitinophagales bacterium]